MNCKKCGNKNPDYARFCVFCGEPFDEKPIGADERPLPKEKNEQGPAIDIERKRPKTASAPVKTKRSAEPVKRIAHGGHNVRPIAENPAQPPRPVKERPSTVIPKKVKPAIPAADRIPPDEALTTSGEKVKIPARRAPVRPVKTKKTNTLVPERIRKKSAVRAAVLRDDEDDEFEDTLKHKILSAVAGVFLLLSLCAAFWLIVTPSGQVFRAGLGLSAPASAYKTLGDNLRKNLQFTKAADAYYDAFRLDSGNYEYALLVGKTQEVVGNQDKAEKAYGICIQLKEDEPEPYQLLSELYAKQGKDEQAAAVRRLGYEKTGDAQFADETEASP